MKCQLAKQGDVGVVGNVNILDHDQDGASLRERFQCATDRPPGLAPLNGLMAPKQ